MKRKINVHEHLTKEEFPLAAGNIFVNIPVNEHLKNCKSCSDGVRDCMGKVFSLPIVDSGLFTQQHG